MGTMVRSGGSTSSEFRLGPKGRVVLPAAVRRAAHIPEGASVVAHAEGEGRIVIETVDAVRARVWGAAPGESEADATTDMRSMRDEDTSISDEAHGARSADRSGSPSDGDPGHALLAHLNLA
jgi:bifunctional DNA-binding transcriptional regulator/antitoxin component of YhaV-PrlF toxin-antitoxin module